MLNELYVLLVSDTLDIKEYKRLFPFISKEKRGKISCHPFDMSQKLSVYAEVFTKVKICEILGIDISRITIEKSKYGKPHLAGYPNFHFNISHTDNAIAVAFSDEQIGVDIERIRTPEFKIAERFFTLREQTYISSSQDPEQAFYEVWTRKEAYLKYCGTGITISLKSFDVYDMGNIQTICLHVKGRHILSVCFANAMKIISPTVLLENDVRV